MLSGSGFGRAPGAPRWPTLFGRLTAPEQDYLRNLVTGNVRQGALDSVMLDAIAAAAELPVKAVRRAAMFSAPTGPIAVAALTGGESALEEFSMLVGRPVRPMLAGSAPDVAAGVEKVGGRVRRRHQARRHPHPGAQARRRGLGLHAQPRRDLGPAARGGLGDAAPCAATDLILDGEAIALDETGRPRPFQDTASTTSTQAGATGIQPFFFDLLLHEGDSLIEAPDPRAPRPPRRRRARGAAGPRGW